MAKDIVETPLMKQYFEMKSKHPDAVLLFRVGDFYETYSDDAIVAAEILGITLTRRANGAAKAVEMAGFPHHALDTYLPKLVRAGEEKWSFPYQENADATFNSSLLFELGVMKEYAEPLLRQVPRNVPEYAEAWRLRALLSYFLPISEKQIPSTSLLREFLGGSSFKY